MIKKLPLVFIIFLLFNTFSPSKYHAAEYLKGDMLELSFSENNNTLSLKSYRKFKGYYNPLFGGNYEFTLQMLSEENKLLFEIPFGLAKETLICDVYNISDSFYSSCDIASNDFVVNVPYSEEIYKLKIYHADTQALLLDYNFNKDSLEKIVNRTLGISSASSYEGVSDPNKINFLILGANYTPGSNADINRYKSAIHDFKEELVKHEPFKSRSNELNFITDYGFAKINCKYTNSIFCDSANILTAANNVGVLYDQILVFVKGDQIAGSAYTGSGVAISTDVKGRSARTMVHEVGHSFGGLQDEYVRIPENFTGANFTNRNCHGPSTPSTEWEKLNVPFSYNLGCTYPNLYRPSENSIMRSTESGTFNEVSKAYLNQAFNNYSSRIVGGISSFVDKRILGGIACHPLYPDTPLLLDFYAITPDSQQIYLSTVAAKGSLQPSSLCKGNNNINFSYNLTTLPLDKRTMLTNGESYNFIALVYVPGQKDKYKVFKSSTTGFFTFKTNYDFDFSGDVSEKDFVEIINRVFYDPNSSLPYNRNYDYDLNLDYKVDFFDFMRMLKLYY